MKIRSKKVMFVGDSMSLNQFQSLICMIHSANPHFNHTYSRKGAVSTFKIPALKISISFLRNALLVDLIKVGNKRVLKLDSVQKSAAAWKGNDILIFDSWHWWLHSGRKQMWDEIQFGKVKVKDMTRLVAYEIGLQTWARWVHKNVDSKRVRIFFQGVSPDHDSGREWGQPNATHCIAEQRPLTLQAYPGGPHPADVVLNRVLKGLKKRVHLLNISKLSQFRVDGHPHIYVTASRRAIDCTHWCLPGVPDIWNQLLYAFL
ncbi:hypothetical protein Leryth_010008 [Lithospermum erythrorhizon]|nr:hypothetical protein Leryth_010008 [Lithospermum erythrorhizon]